MPRQDAKAANSMASTISAAAAVNTTLSMEPFAKGISDIKALTTCKICTRLMYEPYVTKCGHSFCYGCLSQWLQRGGRRRECPECRARIRDEPSPDYTIRNIVHVLVGNALFFDDGETKESLMTEQREQALELETAKQAATGGDGEGIFKGFFRHHHLEPIHDPTDHVDRCPNCNWELEDNYCDHCGLDFEGGSLQDFSDYEEFTEEDEMIDHIDGHEAPFDPRVGDRFGELAFHDVHHNGHHDHDIEDYLFEGHYDSEEPDEEDQDFIDDESLPSDTLQRGSSVEDDDLDSLEELFPGDIHEPGIHGNELRSSPNARVPLRTGERTGDHSSSDSDQSSSDDTSDSGGSIEDSDDSDSDSEPIRGSRRTRTRAPETGSHSAGLPVRTQATSTRSTGSRRTRERGTIIPTERFSPARMLGNRRHTQPHHVIDLTAQDTPPAHRAVRDLPSPSSAESSNSNRSAATTLENNTDTQAGQSEEPEEHEPEPPANARRRKRARIVLTDSEEGEEEMVQTVSRSRRRRLNGSTSRGTSRTHQRGQTEASSTSLHLVSILPPGRSHSASRLATLSVLPGHSPR